MFRQIWPYMMRYKTRMFFGFLFITITNLIGIIPPTLVRDTIDYLKEGIDLNEIYYYAGLIVLFTALSGFFRFLMRRTVIVASRLVENDLRNDLFKQLQMLDMAWYQKNNTGDIMSRLTNDLNAIRSVIGPGVMYTVNLLTTFFFVIIMMLNISPLLTLVALIPVPIMALVVQRTGSIMHKRYLEVQQQFGRISTKAQENLAGIRIIKSYVLEDSEWKHFNELNKTYIEKNMAYAKIEAFFHPSMMLIVGIGSALILLFGGRLIITNVISLGDFVAFMLYMSMLIWPSIAIGWVMGLFLQGTAAHRRLKDILDAEPEIKDVNPVDVDEMKGGIEFRNLTFKYPGNEQRVLEDINLTIDPGEIVAIVGKTGAGKSTLMHLLTREFDSDRGTLFIDGTDIQDIYIDYLRENSGYIPQDTFLFSDSVRNNIAFGVNGISDEEIDWAAQTADIKSTIDDMPERYNTILGERGINISGGQKQRLTIARAILKHPKILLLDDALSAVDTLTEETILNNLRDVMKDKTCLWVSHRISSIKNADKIIVLDQGRIIEQGIHEELLLMNGLYADLFEKQKLEETLELAE